MTDTFDVCVIGSGPAGAFAAHTMARRGCSVAVIEAGGHQIETNSENLLDEEASNITGRAEVGFSRQVGGSSNLWAGHLARLSAVDLISRPDFGSRGWPMKIAELESLYARVDQFLGFSRRGPMISADAQGVLEGSQLAAHETIILDPPFVTTQLVQGQSRLQLMDHCSAHRLIWNESKLSIDGLEYFHKRKHQWHRLRARAFIVAAGTLTNVTLLLHSLSERREALPNLYPLIGKGFSTHPKANIGSIRLNQPITWKHPFINFKAMLSHGHRYQFGLDERVLMEKGILNHSLRFDPPFHDSLYRAFEAGKRAIVKLPFVREGRGRAAQTLTKMGRRVYSNIDRITPRGPAPDLLTVRMFLDQAVRSENRIALSTRRSESGLPLAVINWQFTDADWSNAESFLHLFKQELHKLKIGTFSFERPASHQIVGLHSHFLGGTPLGTSDKVSVVDADLKVHGVENLYVSGPSVFPTFGYANPFYTIAALSLRLGEHLSEVIQSGGARQYARLVS